MKASPFRICLVSGPLTYDAELPPTGITADGDVLRSTSLPAVDVLMTPFVSNSWFPASIRLPSLIVTPAGLLTSMFQNLFVPLKSPETPPMVWADDPENDTVAAG